MMRSLLVLITLLFSTFSGYAQLQTNPFNNRVIAKYYLPAELTWMQANAPEKFNRIRFHYIHSFYITPFSCSNCQFYYPELIDVNYYDRFRSKTQRVTVTDSTFGFHITLYSWEEVEKMISTGFPIEEDELRSASNSVPDFPLYTDTGNAETDLQNYLDLVEEWRQANPEQYRELLKLDSGKHFISATEFLNLPADKQQNIIQNQNLYIIQND